MFLNRYYVFNISSSLMNAIVLVSTVFHVFQYCVRFIMAACRRQENQSLNTPLAYEH